MTCPQVRHECTACLGYFGREAGVSRRAVARRLALRSRQERERWIEPEDFPGPSRIERQIEARADADLEDAAFRRACDPLAIGTNPLVAHGKVDERRENPFRIKPHCRSHPMAHDLRSAKRINIDARWIR